MLAATTHAMAAISMVRRSSDSTSHAISAAAAGSRLIMIPNTPRFIVRSARNSTA